MKSRTLRMMTVFLVLGLTLGAIPALASSSSGNLPNGTPIDVTLDDPLDGTEFLIPTGDADRSVDVSGTASIGLGDPDATIVYVVDVSGSTEQGSGTGCGTFLQCERTFVKALNAAAAASGSVDEVGLAVFATGGAAADMQSALGPQLLTHPGTSDVDIVANSLFSDDGNDGGVTQFSLREVGFRTNFTAGLQQASNIVAASSNGTNIVVFVSDGVSNEGGGGFNAAVAAIDGQGAVIHSIAIGSANCTNGGAGTLQQMANATGGTCTLVPNPTNLPDLIPDLISSSLNSLEIAVDGNAGVTIANADINPDLPQDGPANVTYATTVAGLGPGSHEFCVTAFGNDVGGSGDSGAACVTVDLLQISLAPASETNELGTPGQTHTVTATIAGGNVAGRLVTFAITSGPNAGASGVCSANADCTTDAAGNVSWTYEATQGPAGLGTDTIQASFTLNDPTGATGTDEVTKDWVDTTPPDCECVETVNPSGNNVPVAPGNGGQGQNQDGFYLLDASDAVWPDEDIEIYVTDTGSGIVFGPFPVGTQIKYTQAPGAKPSQKPMTGEIDWHIKGNGDFTVHAVDGSGNASVPVDCLVPPPPQ